jgi:hypothetical protein
MRVALCLLDYVYAVNVKADIELNILFGWLSDELLRFIRASAKTVWS